VSSPVDGWILSGRYRIGNRLGSGGTAEVYRAHDELLHRDVAVKVFRDQPADDELASSARRETELQSLAQLNHPNLIRLLDGAMGPDEPAYLVLDLVDGPDLATRLHDGPLPEDEVRSIGAQIASALDYAHGLGIVHRDVKPANILLGADGPDGGVWARLSDFGTVRMVDSTRLTAADLTVGTASYIAPEQARGSDVGPPADVYSLGLVLIEALTGERCFEGTTYEAVAARVGSNPDVPDWLPADLVALLTAMTALEPDRRPTAAIVAQSLPVVVSVEDAAAVDAAAVDGEAVDAEATTTLGSEQLAALAAVDLAAESDEDDFATEPTRVRHRGGVLVALAALAFAAMISGAAFLLMDNSASGDSPAPPTVPHRVVQPTQSHHHARTTEAGAEVGTRSSATQSQTLTQAPTQLRTAARTASRTAPSSTAPITTTSAPPSSSSATTSAPPPTTSPASSTSPAQVTSAAVATTSPAQP